MVVTLYIAIMLPLFVWPISINFIVCMLASLLYGLSLAMCCFVGEPKEIKTLKRLRAYYDRCMTEEYTSALSNITACCGIITETKLTVTFK